MSMSVRYEGTKSNTSSHHDLDHAKPMLCLFLAPDQLDRQQCFMLMLLANGCRQQQPHYTSELRNHHHDFDEFELDPYSAPHNLKINIRCVSILLKAFFSPFLRPFPALELTNLL